MRRSKIIGEQIPLDSLSRIRRPNFDFVDSAIRNGKAFACGKSGYVIIGAETSLLPGFVVEIDSSELLPSISYVTLIEELCGISCGAIWFDSRDYGVFDILWRSRLKASPTAILFSDSGREVSFSRSVGLEISEPVGAEIGIAKQLFVEMPIELGGLSELELDNYLLNGKLLCGYRNDQMIAAALAIVDDRRWSWISAIAVKLQYRNRGIGVKFLHAIRLYMQSIGKEVLGNVGSSNLFAYKALMRLGMVPIAHGWTASLNG